MTEEIESKEMSVTARRPLTLNSEVGRLVSGHGLSRAADNAHSDGFSPCLLQGLKPISIIPFRHG
jgi:hypothetical protein